MIHDIAGMKEEEVSERNDNNNALWEMRDAEEHVTLLSLSLSNDSFNMPFSPFIISYIITHRNRNRQRFPGLVLCARFNMLAGALE